MSSPAPTGSGADRAGTTDVDEKISNIIVEQLAIDSASITPATKLEDIEADPFKIAEFIASVEEDFGIDIPDADFDGLVTIGDLHRLREAEAGLTDIGEGAQAAGERSASATRVSRLSRRRT
jgi:acyl carrier protein